MPPFFCLSSFNSRYSGSAVRRLSLAVSSFFSLVLAFALASAKAFVISHIQQI